MTKLKGALIILLAMIICSTGFSIYSFTQVYELKSDLKTQSQKCDKDIDGTREAVKQLGSRFETTDAKTIDALIATYDRMETAIVQYDKNVDIYNAQIAELQDRVTKIINYLNR